MYVCIYVYNLRINDYIYAAARRLYGVTFNNLLNIYVLLFLHWIVNKRIPTYLFERIRFVESPRNRTIIVIIYFLFFFSNGSFIDMLFDSGTFFHYISNATPTLIYSGHFYFNIFVNFALLFSFFSLYIYL